MNTNNLNSTSNERNHARTTLNFWYSHCYAKDEFDYLKHAQIEADFTEIERENAIFEDGENED